MTLVILVFVCLAFYLYEPTNFVVIATGIANKIVSFKGWEFTQGQVSEFIDKYSPFIILGAIGLLILEEIPYNRVYKKSIYKINGGRKRMKKKDTQIVVIEAAPQPSKKELKEAAKLAKKEAAEKAKAEKEAAKKEKEQPVEEVKPANPQPQAPKSNLAKLNEILNNRK